MRHVIALLAVLATAFAAVGCERERLHVKDVDRGKVGRLMDDIQSSDGSK